MNTAYNPRSNYAPIGPDGAPLRGPATDLTGVVHDGGITPLYKKVNASTATVKTMDDSGNLLDFRSSIQLNNFQGTMPSSKVWVDIAFGNSVFIALFSDLSTANSAAYSTDGINWSTSPLGTAAGSWKSIAFGSGIFVAVG